jgi:hypothetical protein
MPYRRLPNTDAARLKALKTAFQKSESQEPDSLPFSHSTLLRIKAFLPTFEQSFIVQKEVSDKKVLRNRNYNELYKKAKLYISHFLQVVNFCIARGELSPTIRKFYGLDEKYCKVPEMGTEAEVMRLGEALIKGEAERMSKGGTIITNPTIALVKVHFEKFKESFHLQKDLQKIHSRALNKIADQRQEADSLILDLWNEIEKSFSNLSENGKREHCVEYGVVYFIRKTEKQNAGSLNEKRRIRFGQAGKKQLNDPLQFSLFAREHSLANNQN